VGGRIVRLTLPRQTFRALLQQGVGIAHGTEVTVREFLQKTLGIDAAYVEEELQTVFLDGRPIDDFDGAVVRPGAILALSGALPGLVGATMRRGGYYARLREGITHRGTDTANGGGENGVVVVKLFNRPLSDLAETMATRLLLAPADALDTLEAEAAESGWVRLAVTLA